MGKSNPFVALLVLPSRGGAMRRAIAIALVAALAATVVPAASDARSRATPRKPNVVVIMTDDQPLSTMRVMERTQRLLGRHGVTFDRYYAAWPLCCPARATYLTGQFARNHGVRGNLPPNGGFVAFHGQDNTLPVWLQRAGYRTIHVGKYLNGYGVHAPATVPPGWSDWHGSVDWTTYRMWGYVLSENGVFRRYGSFEDEDPRFYQTDVYTRIAARAIRRAARQRKPFFLNVAYSAVHYEMPLGDETATRPAPRHRGAFQGAPLPDDPSINEADISDKPLLWQHVATRISRGELEEARRRYAGTLEAALAVDEGVDRLVETLRETGQLDNTYIVFTTDNGYFHGQHRFARSKYFLYEPSSHLPLLIRGPGLARGARTQELAEDVDLAATIADATGARPKRVLDGRSMLPFARDPALRSDRPVLFDVVQNGLSPDNYVDFDMDGPDGTPDVLTPSLTSRLSALVANPGQILGEGDSQSHTTTSGGPGQRIAPGLRGVRTDRWAYWEWDAGAGPLGPTEVELYDMANDPFQLESRALDPDYLDTRLALANALARLRDCRGAACQQPVGPIPEPAG